MLLQENKRGPSCPRGTDLTSLFLSADLSLCFVEGSIWPDQCWRETPLPCRAGLRWRHSWWGAERGAERRGWDSGGPLMTRRLLSPSDGSADDSGPPGSCREKKRLRVKRWTEILFCWIKTLSQARRQATANLLKNDRCDLITVAIFAASLIQFSLHQTENVSVLQSGFEHHSTVHIIEMHTKALCHSFVSRIWVNVCVCACVCVIFTSGCPAASSVWTRWKPPSGRCPSSPYCTVHTGLKILDTHERLKLHQPQFKRCLWMCAERQRARHLRCPRTRVPVLAWCCCSRCSGCSWTAGCWLSCVSCSPQAAKRKHRSVTFQILTSPVICNCKQHDFDFIHVVLLLIFVLYWGLGGRQLDSMCYWLLLSFPQVKNFECNWKKMQYITEQMFNKMWMNSYFNSDKP